MNITISPAKEREVTITLRENELRILTLIVSNITEKYLKDCIENKTWEVDEFPNIYWEKDKHHEFYQEFIKALKGK